GALVPLAPTERDLTVQAERPPAPELVEELRRDQETCHPPAPRACHQGEHDAVERGHVVAGDDRRARRRDAVDSLDARPERDPPEEPDHGDAEHPPSVQVSAPSHARMLLAPGPNDRMSGPRHRDGGAPARWKRPPCGTSPRSGTTTSSTRSARWSASTAGPSRPTGGTRSPTCARRGASAAGGRSSASGPNPGASSSGSATS